MGTDGSRLPPPLDDDVQRAVLHALVETNPVAISDLPAAERPAEAATPGDAESVHAADPLAALEREGYIRFDAETGTLTRGPAWADIEPLVALDRERARLAAENERLEEFVSTVSHDLRNPLNILAVAIDEAEQTGDPDSFAQARRTVDRMHRLIQDLLTLARQGTVDTEVEGVDLGRLVERVWASIESGEATLVVETDAVVLADPNRLRELVENLLENAVQHAGPAARVRVAEHADGFLIEDDGPGIPAADRERVFDSGVSLAGDGTGFGLAIVERIAEAHGWTVTLEAGSPGGARFTFAGVDTL